MRVQVVHKMQWKGHVLPVGHRFEIEDGVELPYGVRPVAPGEAPYKPPFPTEVERARAQELAELKAAEKKEVENLSPEDLTPSPDNPMAISQVARQVDDLKGLEKLVAEAAANPAPTVPPAPPTPPRR